MFFRKIDQSCSLVLGMAERLGRDIPGEMARNPVAEAATLRAAVMRCSTCRRK